MSDACGRLAGMDLLLLGALLLLFLGFPLLTMRKQSRRIKEIQEFQSTLREGMVVKVTSGLHGRVSYVGENTVDLEISPGVITTWDKSAVLALVDEVDERSGLASQLSADNVSRPYSAAVTGETDSASEAPRTPRGSGADATPENFDR